MTKMSRADLLKEVSNILQENNIRLDEPLRVLFTLPEKLSICRICEEERLESHMVAGQCPDCANKINEQYGDYERALQLKREMEAEEYIQNLRRYRIGDARIMDGSITAAEISDGGIVSENGILRGRTDDDE